MSNPNTLNAGQQQAADGFFKFLLSEQNQMIIKGPGGVGKTFLMGHMIDYIIPYYRQTCSLMGIEPEYHDVYMTATTNKAADVLSQSTGKPAETIHSFLNLKVKDDFTSGRSMLSRGGNWQVHSKKIIFIDECSMIDTALYNMLQEGTHKSKIIYVGDHCQLAPVMEPISPIYKQGFASYELTQSVRNAAQPHLMAICDQLRHTVKTGEFLPIKAVPGVIDWIQDNNEAEAEIQKHFIHQTTKSRILAHTNARVVQFNDYIRDMRGLPAEYQVGEFLVNNSAVRINNSMLAVEEEVQIADQSSKVTNVQLTEDINFDVRYSELVATNGMRHKDVPIPTNIAYFNDLVRYYQRRKNWHMYFKLKNGYPDLRPRDAATVHKSQGSTYETVFIDLTNLSTCNVPNVAARLLYVAFSRASKRVVLFGNLAGKYGGIVE